LVSIGDLLPFSYRGIDRLNKSTKRKWNAMKKALLSSMGLR